MCWFWGFSFRLFGFPHSQTNRRCVCIVEENICTKLLLSIFFIFYSPFFFSIFILARLRLRRRRSRLWLCYGFFSFYSFLGKTTHKHKKKCVLWSLVNVARRRKGEAERSAHTATAAGSTKRTRANNIREEQMVEENANLISAN
jgi:hypothetical protein